MNDLQSSIITVKELLLTPNLQIPEYQRPYKWTEKNVNQLINDILSHKNSNKSSYRLGTVVIHEDKNNQLNIVDGQQRTITLTLIIYALIKNKKLVNIKELSDFNTNLINLSFLNDISKANIQINYKAIERRINEFDKSDGSAISYLFNNCELVKINISNVSEAFQFFDSQNARGKDLEPHDLLKAFHLREMNNSSKEEERLKAVENWEEMDTGKLSELFANYLYRIKNWSKGRSAKYFTKDDVDVFKGISPEIQEDYPFAKLFRIAHHYTEDYNQSHDSNTNKNRSVYPFQIDQTIINGKRFFEMVGHYNKLINDLIEKIKGNTIINTINNYSGSYRKGDEYTRNLLFCALIYYIDKFGETCLEKAIEKFFIWAYTLRLKLFNLTINSIDNYALKKHDHAKVQLFERIREAIRPDDILNVELDIVKQGQNQLKGISVIIELFKGMKYYE